MSYLAVIIDSELAMANPVDSSSYGSDFHSQSFIVT